MKYKKGTFIIVPNVQILMNKGAGVQALFMWLCKFADENGKCYPSRSKLSECLGCSISSVDKYMKTLEELGLISKENRYKENEKISNIYYIHILDEDEGGSVNFIQPSVNSRLGSINSTHRTQSTELNPLNSSSETKVSQEETFFSPLNETTYYTDAPRRPYAAIPLPDDDLIIEPDESVTPTRLLKRKTAPPKSTAPQVFSLFAEVLGVKTGSWLFNKTERLHAEVLFDERGLESIRKALEFYKQNSHDPYCPQVAKPSALASKWSELSIYKRNKKYKEK